jgi:hypothetical protein
LLRLLFADDQVIISNTEDNLQKAAHKLNKIITEHGLTTFVKKTTTFVTKTKLKAFKGREPVRSKISIDRKIIEQINSFNYLGNLISFEKDVEVDNKLNNYLKITSIINIMSRPQKTLKKTRIKLCNTIALRALLKGSENWTIKARDARRLTAGEIEYM